MLVNGSVYICKAEISLSLRWMSLCGWVNTALSLRNEQKAEQTEPK